MQRLAPNQARHLRTAGGVFGFSVALDLPVRLIFGRSGAVSATVAVHGSRAYRAIGLTVALFMGHNGCFS